MLFQALQKVFRKPLYSLLALITSAAVFAFAVWLPNLSLIVKIMGHPGITFSQKLSLPASLLGSIITNFTPLSASYTIAIAILFGMNVAMIVYFLRRRIDDVKQAGMGTGFLGITSGVLGMGCAACGSFVLKKTFSRAIAELALHYNRAEQVIIRLLISEEDKINGNLEKTQPPNWKRSEKEEEISHTES